VTLQQRIATLAARQHGVVTRAQLLEIGVSPAAVTRRLKSGRLRVLHRGVYVLGPFGPDRAIEMAAVLAGGSAAALSHTSALRLWDMLSTGARRPVHVSVPGTGRSGRPGIVFHRVAPLASDECTDVDGIRITAPGRTIVDVAGMLGSREVELALAAAEREGLIGGAELACLPDRYPRRPGMAMLRALLSEQTEPHFTRSEAERRCLDLLRAAALPRPHTNVAIGPYEVDLFWPDDNVAIEIDGRKYHSSRQRFEGDRRKDNWLRTRGIEVIRVTWRQIAHEGTATAVLVGQALALAHARRLQAVARIEGVPDAPPDRP
jgi:predicted transcriptional regulator of viral defense system/very-short-patch-repair endonuclease